MLYVLFLYIGCSLKNSIIKSNNIDESYIQPECVFGDLLDDSQIW